MEGQRANAANPLQHRSIVVVKEVNSSSNGLFYDHFFVSEVKILGERGSSIKHFGRLEKLISRPLNALIAGNLLFIKVWKSILNR